ncbi:MAG: FtsX-like permease family protein [Pseudomonadales bacterium]|nr:FtsX-like permease family protein [Pseudomonadales bacterium]
MIRLAWRNLLRNRARTALTVGGIGFSVLLVSFAMSLQSGSYEIMIDSATGYFTGHGQISHRDFVDQPRLEHTVTNASNLQARLAQIDGLRVFPRAQAFAVVSLAGGVSEDSSAADPQTGDLQNYDPQSEPSSEKSLGGMVIGVDFSAERSYLDVYENVVAGKVPTEPGQALIGSAMARNLGAQIGDELIVLGSGKQGAVAAAIFVIAGIVETGQVELDRSLLLAPFAELADALYLEDEAHMLVLMVDDLSELTATASSVAELLPEALTVQTWQQLMPMIEQSIELDRAGAVLFYSLLLILVAFAVVNTFVMVLFERTREFGLFMALGMRPGQVIAQVQFEALLLSLLGVALGLLFAYPLITYLTGVGIPLDQMGGEEAIRQMQMGSMERIFPKISWSSVTTAPLVMIVGTQLAALVSTVRVRGIHPVTALRTE